MMKCPKCEKTLNNPAKCLNVACDWVVEKKGESRTASQKEFVKEDHAEHVQCPPYLRDKIAKLLGKGKQRKVDYNAERQKIRDKIEEDLKPFRKNNPHLHTMPEETAKQWDIDHPPKENDRPIDSN